MNEVANANGYSRKAITFAAAASRKVSQNADVIFDEASGSWGTVSHWAITDSDTYGVGNVLAHGAFSMNKTPVSGSTLSVESGQIEVSINAGQMSDFLVHKLLDLAFRNIDYAYPSTWVALTTVPVTDDMAGSTITEPSGNGYARIKVNANGFDKPQWNVAAAGHVDNEGDINFGPASGGVWGTITSVAVVNLDSAGDLLWYDNDTADTFIAEDEAIRIPSGDCDWTLS